MLDFRWQAGEEGHIYLFSYAYLRDGGAGYPVEVIYHASRAAEMGARVELPKLDSLVVLSLAGYRFPPLTPERMGRGALDVALCVSDGANCTYVRDVALRLTEGCGTWRRIHAALKLNGSLLRMGATIRAAWGVPSMLGGGLEERRVLWEVKYGLEGRRLAIKSYHLPAAYKTIVFGARAFSELWWPRYLLSAAGIASAAAAAIAELEARRRGKARR